MDTLQSALAALIGKKVYVKLVLEKSFNGTIAAAGTDYLVLDTDIRSHIIPYTAVAHIDATDN